MNAARQSTSPAVLKTVALLLLLLTLYVWDRVVLAVSLPEIRTALDLTARQTGLIASAFAAGVALVALPSGLLVRRVGFKPVLLCGALIFSLATAYPPWAHGFWDLLASRLLVGLGEGLFNVSLILYLGGVSTHHRATWVGLAATVFGVAASVGPPLIHFVDGAFGGWQVSFYVLAVLGGLLSFCLAILDPAALAKRSEPSKGDVGPSSVTRLLGFWPLLVLVGVVGLSLYSVTGLLPAWTREHFGFTAASADLALGAVGVGLLLGGAPMGLIADRFDRRSYALAIAIVCFLSVSALMALNVGPIFAVVLGALFGMVANSLYVTALTIAQESGGPDSPPLVGLVATVFYGSAFFSGPVMVWVAERFGYRLGALIAYAGLYSVGVAAILLFKSRVHGAQQAAICKPLSV